MQHYNSHSDVDLLDENLHEKKIYYLPHVLACGISFLTITCISYFYFRIYGFFKVDNHTDLILEIFVFLSIIGLHAFGGIAFIRKLPIGWSILTFYCLLYIFIGAILLYRYYSAGGGFFLVGILLYFSQLVLSVVLFLKGLRVLFGISSKRVYWTLIVFAIAFLYLFFEAL